MRLDMQQRMAFFSDVSNQILWGSTTRTTGEMCGNVILRDIQFRMGIQSKLQKECFVLSRVFTELRTRSFLDGNEASDIALDELVTEHLSGNHSIPFGACIRTLEALCQPNNAVCCMNTL